MQFASLDSINHYDLSPCLLISWSETVQAETRVILLLCMKAPRSLIDIDSRVTEEIDCMPRSSKLLEAVNRSLSVFCKLIMLLEAIVLVPVLPIFSSAREVGSCAWSPQE